MTRGSDASRVTIRSQRHPARVVSSYSAGRAKELVAVVGSLDFIRLRRRPSASPLGFAERRALKGTPGLPGGSIELAVRDASAAWQLSAARGDEVTLTV